MRRGQFANDFILVGTRQTPSIRSIGVWSVRHLQVRVCVLFQHFAASVISSPFTSDDRKRSSMPVGVQKRWVGRWGVNGEGWDCRRLIR